MRYSILTFFLIFHFVVTGQFNNEFELPFLKNGDSIVLSVKRNNFQEKVVFSKSKSFTKICFFSKTVVMSIDEEIQISNKEKEKKLESIEEFNNKIYKEKVQFYLGEKKLLKEKGFIYTEKFVLTEERIVYSTIKNIYFVRLSTLVIAGRHTDIIIALNNKVLKNIRINWYLSNEEIVFK